MSDSSQDPWHAATWEGARREQLRRWRALSLKEKLDAVDDLNQLGETLIEARKKKGLPYIDPASGRRIAVQNIAEKQSTYASKTPDTPGAS